MKILVLMMKEILVKILSKNNLLQNLKRMPMKIQTIVIRKTQHKNQNRFQNLQNDKNLNDENWKST